MRLNKFLSTCGVASRRRADELILSGKISVNGKVVSELGTIIDEKKDVIIFDGKKLKISNEFIYLKLNKPKGYICSNSDEKGRKTIFNLLPKESRLFSIGRLDYNTEGLILITNDGEFSDLIIHPRNEIEKEYIATVEGKVLESELAVLRAGVVENGERMPKAKVEILKYDGRLTRLSIIINEGQNRQVRRMFEAIGRTIVLLKRIRIGEFNLGGLTRGNFKEFSKSELEIVNKLKNKNY